jgi:hypothetical protein
MSKWCILDISSFGARITSTFSCSRIPFGFCLSWPPPLRSYGIFGWNSSSWTIPLMRSRDSLVCTSSSWVVPLSPTFVSSS